MTDYVADKKICAHCLLRAHCTRSKLGRSVARHWKESELEVALAFARLPEAQADRRRRRYLMEGSFAHAANRYHFKRARWRRLWRQQIQDWLIAAVQNLALLCGRTGAGVTANRVIAPKVGAPARGFGLFVRASASWRLRPYWLGRPRTGGIWSRSPSLCHGFS